MDSKEIYFLKLATGLCKALGEGSSFAEDFDTDAFGVRLPESMTLAPAVKDAGKSLSVAGSAMADAAAALEAAVDSENNTQILKTTIELAEKMVKFFKALKDFITAFQSQINAVNLPDAGDRAIATQLAAKLGRKLTDYMIINVIESRNPQFALAMKTIGLIEWNKVPEDPADPMSTSYFKKSINLQHLKNLISNPVQHLMDTIGWGSNNFNPADLFYSIHGFYHPESSLKVGTENGDAFLRNSFFTLKRDSSVTPPGIMMELKKSLGTSLSNRIAINDDWGIGVESGITFTGGVAAKLRPPFAFSVIPTAGEVKGELKIFINRNPDAGPITIVGGNGILSLTADDITAGVKLLASADAIAGIAKVDTIFYSDLKKLTLKLGSADGDGFLQKILANAEIEGQVDLGLEFNPAKGLVIKASGGIEIALPVHLQLGPIEITTIYLALKILESGTLSTEISSGFKAELGPIAVTVERMGVKTDFSFSEGADSKYGFFDLGFGFKPPNGLGLSINAGAVMGGGYLSFDFEKGEYAGALELTIAGFISAKAIGLINTKMPDGSKGFSMLIIITAEFLPPFQLSYGFTLNAVGGLLGLNRTMLLDPLRNAVRTGAVNSIMFPQNVIANAPRIISDLKSIFPPYEGKFLIGPMAKIGWGTPTLISLSLGLIIEIPGNIAILGVLKVALPAEQLPLVQIQVLFVGTIDFDKKMLSFDASLYESFILTMTLEGDMAVRLKWGDSPDFLLSVGGFHPSYTPPPLSLPTMKRLAINILNTDIALIRVECYQAVTSNTVQFGAKAEIKFDLSVCAIEGHIGFDALFQFNPFYFIIQVSASFKLSAAGIDVLSVRVKMSLEGPTPWRAKGTGSVSLLFFEIEADFDVTWGDDKNTTVPEIAIYQKFIDDIQKRECWSTVLSNSKNLLVSLRKMDDSLTAPLVLHPAGSLVVQQKLMPLQVKIEKIGSQKVTDVQQITIKKASSSGVDLKLTDVNESFARAQYQNLTDAEKLSKPSFEKMPGGVKISLDAVTVKNGKFVRKDVEYEITIIDKEPAKPFKRGKLYAQPGILFNHFLKGNSVSKSVLSKSYSEKLKPFAEKMDVQEEGYTVAFQSNNKAHTSTATFASEMMAQTYMQDQITKQPGLKKELHIIPNYELQTS